MDPNSNQCSIDYPCNDNTVHYSGLTLPRSFTLAHHGRIGYGVFPLLSIILSPSQSFTLVQDERQIYGVSSDLSNNHSCDPILDLFSVASVGGNSRAPCLVHYLGESDANSFRVGSCLCVVLLFIAVRQVGSSLKVPYTVIRAHTAMGCSFALYSDYLKDLYSFYLQGTSGFKRHLMDEFTSRTAQLKSRKKKNKEAYCAY